MKKKKLKPEDIELVVDWIVATAPKGVIEFVPKGDPMVQEMLSLREDIFANYSVEIFTDLLKKNATINEIQVVTGSGRTLFWYTSK